MWKGKFPFENHYTALIRWSALVVLAWFPMFTNSPSNGASKAKGYLPYLNRRHLWTPACLVPAFPLGNHCQVTTTL